MVIESRLETMVTKIIQSEGFIPLIRSEERVVIISLPDTFVEAPLTPPEKLAELEA